MTHDEWRLRVYQTIGGSSAASSIGKGRFPTPATCQTTLFDRMTRARNGVLEAEQDNDDFRRGRRLERPALDALREDTGLDIQPHPQDEFLTNSKYPWAHCLPDGWLPGGGLLSIKCPRTTTLHRIRQRGLFDDWRIQVEHEAAICEVRFAKIAILDIETMRNEVIDIVPDPVFTELLMSGEEQFDRMVREGNPPEPLLFEAAEYEAEDALRVGVLVRLTTNEARTAAENFVRIRALSDEAGALYEEAKNRLAAVSGCELKDGKLIGGPTAFEVPGLVRVYHSPQEGRHTFDKAKAVKLHPELAGADFQKLCAPSRPFRSYILAKHGD